MKFKKNTLPPKDFSAEEYLELYPDVAAAGVDAWEHYNRHGRKEGRFMNKLAAEKAAFVPKEYLKLYPDVAAAGIDAWTHYDKHGRKEGRFMNKLAAEEGRVLKKSTLPKEISQQRNEKKVDSVQVFENHPMFLPQFLNERATPIQEIGVVVPCYNGLEHLKKLLPSLFLNTTCPHKFIFINDCSPDPEVFLWLKEQCEGREDCLLVENEENLGFPATANRGADLCTGHFVLLNSDTQVPYGWLERLIAPIIKNSSVASVTPFSNAASFHSFPVLCNDPFNREFLELFGLPRIDQIIQSNDNKALFYDWPSAHGFCMAINREAWNNIGCLDAEAFGKGYGEENEWSQRAIKAGYVNVLAPNLYVAHYHGGSFEPEKAQAEKITAQKVLSSKFPHIFKESIKYAKIDPWVNIRAASIIRLLLTHDCEHVLFLNNSEALCFTEEKELMLKEDKCVITFTSKSPGFEQCILMIQYRDFKFKFNNVSEKILSAVDFKNIDIIKVESPNHFSNDWTLALQNYTESKLISERQNLLSI